LYHNCIPGNNFGLFLRHSLVEQSLPWLIHLLAQEKVSISLTLLVWKRPSKRLQNLSTISNNQNVTKIWVQR